MTSGMRSSLSRTPEALPEALGPEEETGILAQNPRLVRVLDRHRRARAHHRVRAGHA